MRRAQHTLTSPLALGQAAWRQLRHIATHKLSLFSARASAPLRAAYFYPGFPHPYSVAYRLFHQLGVPLKHGIAPAGPQYMSFLWKDDTFVEAPAGHELINGNCTDISKEHVDHVHQQVFGYALAVDPLTHVGPIVSKSNLNGAHDGVSLMAPIAKREADCVYQIVIDNRGPAALARPGQVCDMRVAIFDGKPAFSYLKFRPTATRFSNTNSSVSIATLESLFSAAEMASIGQFCQRFGLDYGEIDILRDHASDKIYILDINKTPLGPPNGLSDADRATALRLYREQFSAWIARRQR